MSWKALVGEACQDVQVVAEDDLVSRLELVACGDSNPRLGGPPRALADASACEAPTGAGFQLLRTVRASLKLPAEAFARRDTTRTSV